MPVALYLWRNSEVDEETVQPALSSPQARDVAAPAPLPVPVPADSAEQPAPPAAEVATSAPVVVPVPAEPATPAAGSVLHLEFGDESWTEIRDASGRMLHRQLNPAGSSVDITGRPPFELVIGNAAQARLTYNGRPSDLKPFTDSTVARFTLEE